VFKGRVQDIVKEKHRLVLITAASSKLLKDKTIC